MRGPRTVAVMLLVASLLSLAGDAAARKFQMSGTWIYRNGQVFLPLQFASAIMDATGDTIHRSMGNLTGAFLFPNGPIPGKGGASATGSAPATLRIPAHRFVEDVMALIPLDASLEQITTNVGVDAPYAAATLAPGGGPGSFTWCPGDPACVAGGGMRSTDPPHGAGRNGRVIYRAGANRFGGAMQIGMKRGGYTTALFSFVPYRVGYNRFFGGAGSEIRSLAPGKGPADSPTKQMVYLE